MSNNSKFKKILKLYNIQGEIEISKITASYIEYLIPYLQDSFRYDYNIKQEYEKIVDGLFDAISDSIQQTIGAFEDASNELGRIKSEYN